MDTKRIPFLIALAILAGVLVLLLIQRSEVNNSDLSRVGPSPERKAKIQAEAEQEAATNNANFELWLKTVKPK